VDARPPTGAVDQSSRERSLAGVLLEVGRHPVQLLLRRWNWKSAVMSSAARGLIFFVTNLSAGVGAAAAAFATEVVFRMTTSGFYGALTQAFRHVEPAWQGMAAAIVVLPIVAHSLELGVHWLRETPELMTSIASSVAFTILSTAFNLFAMRRGALVVGAGSQPLQRDLRRMPALVAEFAAAIAAALRRTLTKARPRTV
jgi:hypothetical protein